MTLPAFIEFANNAFEQARYFSYRPFVFDNGRVSALFGPTRSGPLRVGSVFVPIKAQGKPDSVVAYACRCTVAAYDRDFQDSQPADIGELLDNMAQPIEFKALINLDRLCRTVHVLNYWTLATDKPLLLTVDPRHVLAMDQDHGAYLAALLAEMDLGKRQIIVSMSMADPALAHYEALLAGLANYRQRGFLIAMDIACLGAFSQVQKLIARLVPDYLCVCQSGPANGFAVQLRQLQWLLAATGGKVLVRANTNLLAPVTMVAL